MYGKVKSIAMVLVLLCSISTPALAAVYFTYDAESGTVGNNLLNPPFCMAACGGDVGTPGTIQSSGGTPNGSKYFQWQTVDNQLSAYNEVSNSNFPIAASLGKTFYLAYYFNFTRINGRDIWHTSGQSGDKGVEIEGNGLRWVLSRGAWDSLAALPAHTYSVWIGNPTYHVNPSIEYSDTYRPNQNGYSGANPVVLQYERWYSAVMAVKVAADATGSVTVFIDGVKILEYTGIKTSANTSPTIDRITMGGTIAQPAYDAPAHLRKFDAMILTDNLQDIVNGGYLKAKPNPPSLRP